MGRHIVCLSFDFDTMSGFVARGQTTPTFISRGEFGVVGARRILQFLSSRGIFSTLPLVTTICFMETVTAGVSN